MDTINKSYVYCILNTQNKRTYIGSTTNFSSRKRQHRNDLKKHKHPSKKMQHDYDNLGEDSFHFIILEEVLTFDRQFLFSREQHWIDLYKPEYNSNPLAGNWFHESAFSPEARQKHREKVHGRKQSQEEKDRRAKSLREYWARPENKGKKKVSQKQKDHLSKINTGELNPNWGKKRTPEQLERMSNGRSNIVYIFRSPEGKNIEFTNLLGRGTEITGVPYGALRNLIRGLTSNHDGWTFVERRLRTIQK